MLFRNISFLLVVLFLNGCAGTSGITIPKMGEVELPNEVRLDVPKIYQNDRYSCATTSTTMALSYYEGKRFGQDKVWKISKTNPQTALTSGNDMSGLKRIAKHYGYKSDYVQGLSLHDLEYLTSQGIPVVINILQRVGQSATHAVLVIGYNRDEEIFYINDPIGPSRISYEKLISRWSAHLSSPKGMSYRSGFIMYPKST